MTHVMLTHAYAYATVRGRTLVGGPDVMAGRTAGVAESVGCRVGGVAGGITGRACGMTNRKGGISAELL
jgi:hypothetical protein